MSDLVETANQAGFQTLIKAAEAAGLIDLLKSPNSFFTVFAPTDEAFAKLPKGTLDALLQDIPKLKRIIAYHVADGDVRAEDLLQIDEATTVEGSVVAIEHQGDKIKVNNANVTKTDVTADNGVIHVIDAVLMPAMVAGGT